MLVAEYQQRVETVLARLVPTCETLLFTGGGDRGIYPAGKALVQALDCEKLVLLRIDPHMDERSIFCRSDPEVRRGSVSFVLISSTTTRDNNCSSIDQMFQYRCFSSKR